MIVERKVLNRVKLRLELGVFRLQSQVDAINNEIEQLLAQPEQEPVVKITSIHADGENLPVVITGVVLSDAVNIWDLPIKNNNLLFLAPPKREPLSDEEIVKLWANKSPANEFECVRLVEQAHGIGGGE